MGRIRTGFKKSRGGCNRCKQRKVKCSEGRPVCNNCHRHGVACEYAPSIPGTLSPPRTQWKGDAASSPTGGTSGDAGSDSIFESVDRRHLELQLLHHFVTVVGLSFPSSSLQLSRGLWTVDAVRVAFQHEFLLNAIFAIASLHLVRGLPNSPRFMEELQLQQGEMTTPGLSGVDTSNEHLAKVHSFYLDLAVKQQREAVAQIVPENANALIYSSLLISYQGLKLLPGSLTNVPQLYSPPVQWLRMSRGIVDVSAVAGRIGLPEPVIPKMVRVSGEPDFTNHGAFFNVTNRERFQHLLDFDAASDRRDGAETGEAYEKAVAYIGRLAYAVDNSELPRVIFRLVLGFALLTPAIFITLVEAGRPRALVILAHYFALSKSINDHWIFHGLADREVEGLRGLIPPKWQHLLDWPLRFVRASSLSSSSAGI